MASELLPGPEQDGPARSGRLRSRVYHALEVEADDRGWERAVNILLLLLIIGNVAAVILETVEDLHAKYAFTFEVFESASVAIFSVEYLLRVWTCPEDPRFTGAFVGRLRFVLSPLALVDLAAILPSYLPALIPIDLRFARAPRLLRLARWLKIARYSQALDTLGRVLRSRKAELGITAFLGLLLLLFASSLMYFVEHEAQPRVFSSIPSAMWWGVVTLTTVGYGDIYPVTSLGKFIGGAIEILGIGLFALPAGIVASGFAEELQRRKQERGHQCPHCGKEFVE